MNIRSAQNGITCQHTRLQVGLRFAAPPTTMNLSLTYRALAERQVDFAAGDATNGLIDKLDLVALEDDKHYFPPYEAVPVVRAETLQKYPQVRIVLERLQTSTSSSNRRIMFQLEFVGFSRLGVNPLETLKKNIPRYQYLRETVTSPNRFSNYD